MSRSIPALVKPELLAWARRTAGFPTVERAAQKAKLEAAVLDDWESGRDSPSMAQLRNLGEVYKRPIAVFFLSEPPRGFDAQKEFRRLAGIVPGNESPELLLALREALYRREAAIELHRLMGEEPHQIKAVLHPDMDAEEAGRQIRGLLGVNWLAQLQWDSAYHALNAWRGAIEARGVLVFQSSEADLNEMRGICIPDQPMPVILLNSNDAPHGRIFSLLHEFVHILLHAGGHETGRLVGKCSPEEQPMEVAANAFAATALLPGSLFLQEADKFPDAERGDNSALKRLAERVRVSPETALRRLVKLNRATESVYRRKREEWGATQWYLRQSSSTGGPTIQVKTIANEGRGFTQMVMTAYDQRLITTSAASDYLGIKPCHFTNIRSELAPRPSLQSA